MNDGGPAYPQQMVDTDKGRFSVAEWGCARMTLRQHYACEAMKEVVRQYFAHRPVGSSEMFRLTPTERERVREEAFAQADVMLKEDGNE